MVRARRELERVAEAGRQGNEAGKHEVLRSEFAQEVAAMQQVQERQRTRVELDVGGVRHVTSVATLRSRPTIHSTYRTHTWSLQLSSYMIILTWNLQLSSYMSIRIKLGV